MTKTKILYLHAGAEMYGADKVLLDLIRRLDKEKYEPHVILPTDGPLVEQLKLHNICVEVLPYPILRRKHFNIKGIFSYINDYVKYSKLITSYAKNNHIDIIHNNTTAVLEGIYVSKKINKPLIWHVHEIIVKPKIISNIINFLMGRYANKIITVSQAVANHIKKSRFIKNSQVDVIYNGVDNEIYRQIDTNPLYEKFNISEATYVIGMVGRVNAWKGQGDFLNAVTPILSSNKNVVAVMAGSAFAGEEWRVSELDTAIAALPFASQIHRIDYYSNTTELYNLFDVFVLPSTNPDPLPTVVLEAMACGKPIVAYKHGGVCEMVESNVNGLLVKPNSPELLTHAINELLENDAMKKQFGKNSENRQKTLFSLESYIANFSKLYDDVIHSKK